jgi:hypothetical protein
VTVQIDRSKTALKRLDGSGDDGHSPLSPVERVLAVWPLTQEVWRLADPAHAERRLQRNVAVVSDAGAEHLVVRAYAMAAHGYARATGDFDILINPTPANATRVHAALKGCGAPRTVLTEADLASAGTVYQIDVAPRRIDILTSISGVTFAAAAQDRLLVQLEGCAVPLISVHRLIQNKEAAGRPRDIDAGALRRRPGT